MSKTVWTGVIVAIIFGGGGFYAGTKYQASQTTTTTSARFAGGTGSFAGRGAAGFGGAGGGATIGTILSIGNGSMTIQLPNSTSSTATTGTKLVLLQDSTQIDALENVPASSLQVGQTVTVAGTTNADGSVTATSVMVRPAGAGGYGGRGGTGGQTQTQSSGTGGATQ
jgi:hypothetical protein